MGQGHDHGHTLAAGPENEKRLLWALGLTASFLVVEVAGGIITGSLALLSDAAHMFTDVTALVIALAAVRVGRRAVDDRRSYGYQRFEILAAAFNALLLFAVAGYILYEAWERFLAPPAVDSTGMFAIAVVGLVVNFISLKLLSGGRDESLNVKGAYLEVWSDLLGSAGVMAAAIGIYFTGWRWLDPLVAVAIGLWVLPRTWKLLKESTHILLEGTPADVDMAALRSAMLTSPGVSAIHDLHVWTVTSGRPHGTRCRFGGRGPAGRARWPYRQVAEGLSADAHDATAGRRGLRGHACPRSGKAGGRLPWTSPMNSRRRHLATASLLATTALVAAGCASRHPAELPWKEGWREAVVVEVVTSDPHARPRRECGKENESRGFANFVRAKYKASRTMRISIIVPVTDASLRPSDPIYVNIKHCGLAAVRRGAAH